MDAETRFATLFAEAYPALQRYARYRGLRGADADDLVAETLTAAQAGVALGCRAGAVRVRLHRARNRLARELGAAETPPPPATGPGHDDPDKETVDGPIN